MKMPGKDGLALVGDIRADAAIAATPVLLLSSLVSTLPADAAGDPMLHQLSKPVRRSDLARALADILQTNGGVAETPNGKVEPGAEALACEGEVLLVEDNPINLEVAAEILRGFGCRVDTAVNGQEALDASADRRYDLVLMDCQMPVMDGCEATRAIRACAAEGADGAVPRTTIVALTANALDTDRAACLAAGMDDFLTKPFSREMMADTVGRYLRRRDPESAGGATDARAVLDPAIVEPLRTGRQELWRRLTVLFAEESARACTKIVAGLAAEDAAAVKAAAHSMKSAAANVGAMTLSDIYRRLEKAAAGADLAACAGLCEQAASESEAACDAMDATVGPASEVA